MPNKSTNAYSWIFMNKIFHILLYIHNAPYTCIVILQILGLFEWIHCGNTWKTVQVFMPWGHRPNIRFIITYCILSFKSSPITFMKVVKSFGKAFTATMDLYGSLLTITYICFPNCQLSKVYIMKNLTFLSFTIGDACNFIGNNTL